jgi:hypothetical protein
MMSMNIDREEMRAFQYREEHGHLPDEQFVMTEQDGPLDPEQLEIVALVNESYAETNRRRREERDRGRIAALESLLAANGIDIPEEI